MARRYTRRSDAFAHLVKKSDRSGENEVDAAARVVVATVRPHLKGDVWKPETWINAAEALGVKVVAYKYKDRAPGFYYGGTNPVIYYNIDDPEILRVLTISHELNHHIIAQWPDSPYPRESIERYDSPNTMQHRIARRAEEMQRDLKRQ